MSRQSACGALLLLLVACGGGEAKSAPAATVEATPVSAAPVAALREPAAPVDDVALGAPIDASPDPPPEPASDAGAAPAARVVQLPSPQTSDAELRLLTRARRLLRAAPAKALALTVDHQRAFKQPRQAERRELIAIEALVRLGRGDEARARARAFYAAFPGSSETARVRSQVAARP